MREREDRSSRGNCEEARRAHLITPSEKRETGLICAFFALLYGCLIEFGEGGSVVNIYYGGKIFRKKLEKVSHCNTWDEKICFLT